VLFFWLNSFVCDLHWYAIIFLPIQKLSMSIVCGLDNSKNEFIFRNALSFSRVMDIDYCEIHVCWLPSCYLYTGRCRRLTHIVLTSHICGGLTGDESDF